jgi:hypothetical protein
MLKGNFELPGHGRLPSRRSWSSTAIRITAETLRLSALLCSARLIGSQIWTLVPVLFVAVGATQILS